MQEQGFEEFQKSAQAMIRQNEDVLVDRANPRRRFQPMCLDKGDLQDCIFPVSIEPLLQAVTNDGHGKTCVSKAVRVLQLKLRCLHVQFVISAGNDRRN